MHLYGTGERYIILDERNSDDLLFQSCQKFGIHAFIPTKSRITSACNEFLFNM